MCYISGMERLKAIEALREYATWFYHQLSSRHRRGCTETVVTHRRTPYGYLAATTTTRLLDDDLPELAALDGEPH